MQNVSFYCYAERSYGDIHYGECCKEGRLCRMLLFTVIICAIMANGIMVNVVMLNVVYA